MKTGRCLVKLLIIKLDLTRSVVNVWHQGLSAWHKEGSALVMLLIRVCCLTTFLDSDLSVKIWRCDLLLARLLITGLIESALAIVIIPATIWWQALLYFFLQGGSHHEAHMLIESLVLIGMLLGIWKLSHWLGLLSLSRRPALFVFIYREIFGSPKDRRFF